MAINQKTIIVMCDNREPTITPVHRARYYELAAVINLIFAKTHGYAFRYYLVHAKNQRARLSRPAQTDSAYYSQLMAIWRKFVYLFLTNNKGYKIGKYILKNVLYPLQKRFSAIGPHAMRGVFKKRWDCMHLRYGYRASPWCKLIGLYDALIAGFERVVYIDTDAIFNHHQLSITSFIESAKIAFGRPAVASLVLTDNYPWPQSKRDANSGFLLWRNGPPALEMVRAWWNFDAGPYHHQHDYDQYALQKSLIDSQYHKKHIAVIQSVTFREKKGQFLRHVGSDQFYLREYRFRMELKRLRISNREFARLLDEIKRHHVVHLNAGNSPIHQ